MNKRVLVENVQQGSIIAVLAILVVCAVLRTWYLGPVVAGVIIALVGLVLVSSFYLDFVPRRKATDAWMLKTVRYYRPLGFFGRYEGLADEEVVRRLKLAYSRRMGHAMGINAEDMALLSLDKSRVFWGDLEADIAPENNAYVSLLKSMARISRGTFEPTDVSEIWEGDNGPLRVDFTLNGARQSLQPTFHDDWLDAQFIVSINQLVEDAGMQFWVYDTHGQDLVLVALTDDEAKQIRRERHLSI